MRTSSRILLASLLLAACGADPPPAAGPGAHALYDTSSSRGDFFAMPWPDDSRLVKGSDGVTHLDLAGFPRPGGIVDVYLDIVAADPTDGFGTQAAVYFRFDAPLDPASLPQTAADSVSDAASVFLMDADPASPTFGKRTPVLVKFSESSGNYIGPDWLAIRPMPGFPLRESGRYVAVVTDRVRAKDHGPLLPATGFDAAAHVGMLSDTQVGGLAHVVVSAAFGTKTVTPIMKALRDAVYATPAPTVANFTYKSTDNQFGYDLYVGQYDAPNFQEGDPPYAQKGGQIHLGQDGKPAPVRTETLRFAVTVPTGDPPAGGWPVALYAHGTGGDYMSFVDDQSGGNAARIVDAKGNVVARMAMISIDQVLHGPRAPASSDPDLTFFNFQNLHAARDNAKQGALDDFDLLRLVEGFDVAQAPTTGKHVFFDKDRIYFKGHSQGGLTGPLFLAYEPKVKAAVLSGAGGGLVLSLLSKTEPVNIPDLVGAIVEEDVDEYHPLLNLMQVFLEDSDPANYAHLFFRAPPAGQAPKSIYQSMGLIDHYTPVPTIKALALAMGVEPAGSMLEPIDGMAFENETWGAPPLMKNVDGGAATGVVVEYKVPTNSAGAQRYDGHFVVFDDPAAVLQSNMFLGTHAATGTAELVPAN